jgi:DNA-directed RNA polymerase specialized sigma24 family protein
VRLKWNASPDDSSDLVQSFFTALLERETLTKYDPAAGRFHAWLRTCLDHFVSNEFVAASREKRGGGIVFQTLDYLSVEAEMDDSDKADAETLFYREWVRSFFGLAITRLEQECASSGKQRQFAIWKRYDMAGEAESYAALAGEFGLPVTTVTNELAALRRRFRKVLLETLREVTADEREYRNEARSLLGVEV